MHRRTSWGSRCARVLGVAAAGLLLAPVPALALTFLGPWQVLQNLHSAGIPAAVITAFPDTANGKGPLGLLAVNMGEATSRTAGFSTVTVQRQFTVGSPTGERLLLSELFSQDLKNASFVVRAALGHFQNGRYRVDYGYPTLAGAAGSHTTTFSGRNFSSPPIHPGQVYYLTLTITYSKKADGFWRDHRGRHRHMSHHVFEFGRA